MNWNKIWVIFENTMAKEWRNKFLVFLLILTIGLIFLVNVGMDYVGQIPGVFLEATLANKKLYTFYYIINTWNVLLSIIMGVSCIKSDLGQGVYSQILSFPVKRAEYLISRILGSSAIVCFYYIVSIILALSVFAFSSEGKVFIDPGLFLSFIPNIFLILASISLTVLISLYLNKVPALITSFILVIMISSANANLGGLGMDSLFSDITFFKFIGLILYFFLPHLGVISGLATDITMGKELNVSLGWEVLHLCLTLGVIYILVLLSLRKREA